MVGNGLSNRLRAAAAAALLARRSGRRLVLLWRLEIWQVLLAPSLHHLTSRQTQRATEEKYEQVFGSRGMSINPRLN